MTDQPSGTMGAVRHAEYKVPDGKLLVVDLQVANGRLHGVQLSGDFFLEPPEALTRINAALEGMRQDASARQFEEAVQAVIGPDVMMYGITVAGVAAVIQRALA